MTFLKKFNTLVAGHLSIFSSSIFQREGFHPNFPHQNFTLRLLFLSAIRIITVLIQIEAAAYIQGRCLLSSASISNGHYSRVATIKGAAFNQVNTVYAFWHAPSRNGL